MRRLKRSQAGFWCTGEVVSQQAMGRWQLIAYSGGCLSMTREVCAIGGHGPLAHVCVRFFVFFSHPIYSSEASF